LRTASRLFWRWAFGFWGIVAHYSTSWLVENFIAVYDLLYFNIAC
jgi:hypothetical protein